jgi:hypothetical protein
MKSCRVLNLLVAVGCSLVQLTGCSSQGSLFRDPGVLLHDPGRVIGRPKVEKNVVRIVTLWEAAQGRDPSDKPARGFAGQILFFGPNGETGARVNGRVVIYEYDNYESDSIDEPEPLHSFTFEPDAWDVHRTEGTLGHSYSCFIPYMNRHRDQVHCGLRVEFIGEDGRRVSSEIVEVMLPSRSASAKAASLTRGFVRETQLGRNPVIHQVQVAEPDDQKAKKLESVSIPLPKK